MEYLFMLHIIKFFSKQINNFILYTFAKDIWINYAPYQIYKKCGVLV